MTEQEPLTLDQFARALARYLGAVNPAWGPRVLGEDAVRVQMPGGEPGDNDVLIGLGPPYAMYQAGQTFPETAAMVLRGLEEVTRVNRDVNDFATASPDLRLRLMTAAHRDRLQADLLTWDGPVLPEERRLLAQPWQAGLCLVVVLAQPTTQHYVTTGRLHAWGQAETPIWRLARAQTVAALAAEEPDAGTRQGWRLAVWNQPGAATRLALPELWPRRQSRVVAVPHEHVLAEWSTSTRRWGRPPPGTMALLRDFLRDIHQVGGWTLRPDGYFRWVAGGDPEYVALEAGAGRGDDDRAATIDGGRDGTPRAPD